MKNYFQEFKKKRMFMPVILITAAVTVLIFTFAVPWDISIVDQEIPLVQITTLTFADLTEYIDLSDVENLRLDLEDSPNPLHIIVGFDQSEYTNSLITLIQIYNFADSTDTRTLISTIELSYPLNTLIVESTNHSSGDTIDTEGTASVYIQNAIFYLKGGDDYISVYGGMNSVRIIGGDGDDRIHSGDVPLPSTLSFTETNYIFGGNGNDVIYASASVENLIYGGSGNDQLTAYSVYGTTVQRLYGNAGDDIMHCSVYGSRGGASAHNVSLYGGSGNDTLYGSFFSDNLYGDSGNDDIRGGYGNDRCDGGNGNDVLRGGAGNDRCDGGIGNDVIRSEDGNDEINCGDGNDFGFGGNGDDTMRGNNGNDTLLGEDGDDRIYGDSGDDYLAGGPGRDRLLGGPGRDRLLGGPGRDTLNSDSDDLEVVE